MRKILFTPKVLLNLQFCLQYLKIGNVFIQSIKNSQCDPLINNFRILLRKLLKIPNCPYIFEKQKQKQKK